jgi:Post-segregation antitoxin CcdA
VSVVKHRITVTLEHALVQALDARPGASRSQKVERLLAEALAARAHHRWVSELRAFYRAGPDASDRQEDLDWQALAAAAFERDD